MVVVFAVAALLAASSAVPAGVAPDADLALRLPVPLALERGLDVAGGPPAGAPDGLAPDPPIPQAAPPAAFDLPPAPTAPSAAAPEPEGDLPQQPAAAGADSLPQLPDPSPLRPPSPFVVLRRFHVMGPDDMEQDKKGDQRWIDNLTRLPDGRPTPPEAGQPALDPKDSAPERETQPPAPRQEALWLPYDDAQPSGAGLAPVAQEEQEERQAPAFAPAAAAVAPADPTGGWVTTGVVLALLLGILVASDGPRAVRWKRWWSLAGALLTLRKGPDDPLDSRSRRLYEAIRDNPGISTQELAERAGLGRRVVERHLETLGLAKLVESTARGRSHHHFAARARISPDQQEACILLRHRNHGSLLAFILDHPGMSQRGLAAAIGMHPSQANASLRSLLKANLVSAHKAGNAIHYYAQLERPERAQPDCVEGPAPSTAGAPSGASA